MASLDLRTEIPTCSRTIRTRTPRLKYLPDVGSVDGVSWQQREFHGRRSPFEKAGFDAIYFREDLDRDYDLRTSPMGIVDSEVFRISAEQLARKGSHLSLYHWLTTQ